jgi:hypothetical protein
MCLYADLLGLLDAKAKQDLIKKIMSSRMISPVMARFINGKIKENKKYS